MNDLSNELQLLCSRNNCTLLYASYFGSTLYGTSITGKSDLDIKGLFLPAKETMLLGNNQKSITFSTGKSDSKNTESDVDIQLWSLQYFLKTLLPQGDTGGLDLLFSVSNKDCIIYKSDLSDIIFRNYSQFVNCKNQNAYIGYCIGQAKKYGIKGSKLGIIKQIKEYLDNECRYNENDRLITCIEDIIAKFYHPQYCFTVDKNDDIGLVLCERMHMGKITMKEFYGRLVRHYDQYGERAKLAMENKGIDWKALSHAVRCLYQVQELIETGKIQFPLKYANELIKIKQGQYTWEYLEKLISTNLELVNLKLENVKQKNYNYNFVDAIILGTYNILEKQLEIVAEKQELEYFNDRD